MTIFSIRFHIVYHIEITNHRPYCDAVLYYDPQTKTFCNKADDLIFFFFFFFYIVTINNNDIYIFDHTDGITINIHIPFKQRMFSIAYLHTYT